MTVAELVAKLRELPQDAEVVLPMEQDFAIAHYVGLHKAWNRTRGPSYYAGDVRLRFEWELDEDIDNEIREGSIVQRPEVVLLTTRVQPSVT